MKFSFLFPGQGSQSVGMMNAFSDLDIVRNTFNEASDILGRDLWNMAEKGPDELLAQTTNTQPLMLVSDVAMYRAWRTVCDAEPSVLAGHSLGEYAALVASDALGFSDAVSLVQTRAELMQSAVPAGVGAMAAVLGLDDEQVITACERVSEAGRVAEPANFNAPGQVVIAGHKDAVEAAVEEAKSLGAKRAMTLPMSVPSHCSLITEAANSFFEALESVPFETPKIPVIHNESVSPAGNAQEIRQSLKKQLYRPVRWSETVGSLSKHRVTHVSECGPGKVLSGLCKRINKELLVLSISDPESMRNTALEISA